MMTAPSRIQLRRNKGWSKPDGAIVVARPSRWGNPWTADSEAIMVGGIPVPAPRSSLVRIFRWHLVDLKGDGLPFTVADVRAELRGRDLACWCPLDEPCHADVLLELANA
jgi:hypothetical protein